MHPSDVFGPPGHTYKPLQKKGGKKDISQPTSPKLVQKVRKKGGKNEI